MGLPYLPISWGGAGGVNVDINSIHGASGIWLNMVKSSNLVILSFPRVNIH